MTVRFDRDLLAAGDYMRMAEGRWLDVSSVRLAAGRWKLAATRGWLNANG